MEEVKWSLSILLSSISLVGVVVGVIIGWVKISEMIKNNAKILSGYTNRDGSPIFRTKEDCKMLHQETISTTCKKIDEVKQDILESRREAREIRTDLKRDIVANKTVVSAMFLEIKEFMGGTVKAIDNLEKRP